MGTGENIDICDPAPCDITGNADHRVIACGDPNPADRTVAFIFDPKIKRSMMERGVALKVV